jgi:membrane-associated phospholipid phosphatase
MASGIFHDTSMNAESSRLRSTGTTSSDMRAIWAGALLVVYLAVTGILLIVGHSRVLSSALILHFVMLAVIASATWVRGVPRWLRLWAPLLSLLFLYSEIPNLIQAAGHARLFDMKVIQWERLMFGAQPALEWSVRWPSRVLSELLHAAYLSYYGIIFAVPAALYLKSRTAEFVEATFVLMVTFVACLVWYIVFPVAGPRYLWPSATGGANGPIRSAALWLLEAGSSRGTAFPSSHVAVAVTQSILAVRYFGRRGLIVGALTAGLALGAVYGGFHYAIDVLAGLVFGVVITIGGLRLAQRLARAGADQANANAPT